MEEAIKALSVPVIVSIVYGCIDLYKQIINGKEKLMRLIPIIAAFLGAIIGVVAFYVYPSVLVANNIWQAIIMGGASGLTATGANQVLSSLIRGKITRMKIKDKGDNLNLLYANAMLLKLYRERIISLKVYELALEKCKNKLMN